MDQIIKKLEEYGADIEGTMGRFLGDTELYENCLATFLKDEAFSKLGDALSEKNYTSAFEHAHTLKGVAGNMGLTPLYKLICGMVETLRAHEHQGLEESYEKILEQLELLGKLQS